MDNRRTNAEIIVYLMHNDFCTPHNDFCTPHNDFCTPHNDFCTPHNDFCTPHNDFCTPHNDFCTPHNDFCTLHNDFLGGMKAFLERPRTDEEVEEWKRIGEQLEKERQENRKQQLLENY